MRPTTQALRGLPRFWLDRSRRSLLLLLAVALGLVSLSEPNAPSADQNWTATWTQRADSPAGPRSSIDVAFDSVSAQAVLFGGAAAWSLNDVWQYDPGSDKWTQLEPDTPCPTGSSPPAGREQYALEYDPGNQLVWVFGGGGTGCAGQARMAGKGTKKTAIVDQTLPTTTPDYYKGWIVTVNGESAYVSAYDPLLKVLTLSTSLAHAHNFNPYFLYQPGGRTFSYSTATRSWGSITGFVEPTSRLSPAMAYSSRNAAIVMFGGQGWNDTWALNAGAKNWMQLLPNQASGSPPGMAQLTNSMVYDVDNDVFILFGGCLCAGDSGPSSGDTWAYRLSTNTWTRRTPSGGPLPRQGHNLVYDSTNKVVLLFGGFDSQTGNYFNDLWVYRYTTNTWTQIFPSNSPPGRRTGAMVYDPIRQRTILYGGKNPGLLQDVWALQLQGPSSSNPTPTLTSLSSDSTVAGGPAFVLTVTGANFTTDSKVRWKGLDRPTTFVRSTQLQANISATDIASPATAQISVGTPAPGGGTSNSLTFTVLAPQPVPALTAISPANANVGGASTALTATGSNFVPNSVVRINGSARVTTFVSATALTATLLAGDLATVGTLNVSVFTPAPGGGTSASRTFTVVAPDPTPVSQPAALTVTGQFLGVTGEDKVGQGNQTTASGTTDWHLRLQNVKSDPAAVQIDSFVSGTSSGRWVTPFNVTNWIVAKQFASGQLDLWFEPYQIPTTFSVTVTYANGTSDSVAGIASGLTATTSSAPAAGASTTGPSTTATVPAPTLGSISPINVAAGGSDLTLTATGANFTSTSVLQVNGSTRVTTVGSLTQLTATILASDIAVPGTASITVLTPAPGGGISTSLPLTAQTRLPGSAVTVQPGQWVLLPGSVGSVQWRDPQTGKTIDQFPGAGSARGLLGAASAWVGAILDERRGQYVALNWGGHSSTADNSVLAFDIQGKAAPSGDAPPAQYGGAQAWNRWTDPSPPSMQPTPQQNAPDFLPDGKPTTTHSYGGMQHMLGPNGEIDRYWFTGGNKYDGGEAFQSTAEYDPKTKTWRQSDPKMWGNKLSSAWDPSRLRVLFRDYGDLWQYDPQAALGKRYTQLTNDQIYKGPEDYTGSAIFDKQRNRYLEAGYTSTYGSGIRYYVLDPQTGAPIRDPSTGRFMRPAPIDLSVFPDLSPDLFWRSPSFIYDEISRDYVLHLGLPISGGGNSSNLIFRVNPDTWAVTIEKSTNSPSNSVRSGMYSKMRHLVSVDLYVQVVDAAEGVWLYRPTRAGVAATTAAATTVTTSSGSTVPVTGQFLGVTGEDKVGPDNQTAPNGVKDWHFRLSNVRSDPASVQINNFTNGVGVGQWNLPYAPSHWILAKSFAAGTLDLWVEPYFGGLNGDPTIVPGQFTITVTYADGTTDRVTGIPSGLTASPAGVTATTTAATTVTTSSGSTVPVTGQFLGVTGEDKVGPDNQTAPNGVKDWHFRLSNVRSDPASVQINNFTNGVGVGQWNLPYAPSHWVLAKSFAAGTLDLWVEPYFGGLNGDPTIVPGQFTITVTYADGTTDRVTGIPSGLTSTSTSQTASSGPAQAPSGTGSVAPSQSLPVGQWVERPNGNMGAAYMGGLGGKHGRAFYHAGLRSMVFAGGDWRTSQPQYNNSGDGSGSEIWSLNTLTDTWTLQRPFCVPGQAQPGSPDTVGWVYDSRRNRGLMNPGFYFITQGATDPCGSIYGWGGYAFDFTTKTFIGPDAPAGLPAPPTGWGGDGGASYSTYDSVNDELVRIYGTQLQRLNLGTKTWRVQNLSNGDPNWNPITNRAQLVIDTTGRALFFADSQARRLVRVSLSDGAVTSSALPSQYVAPPGDAEVYLAFDPVNRVVLVPNNVDMGISPLNGLGIYKVDAATWEWQTVPSAVTGSVWGFDENTGALIGIGKRTYPGTPSAYYLYKYK